MHTFGKDPVSAAGLIIATLLLSATMAVAYGGGGNDGPSTSAGGVEDKTSQQDLSVSFGGASPSTEPANVESFGGSTISRHGLSAIGQVFSEAGGREMHSHLDGMGKTLEVLGHGRAHGGLTIVRGVPLVTRDGDPTAAVTTAPAENQIGAFTPSNGPSALERARNGSDPERNPEQAEIAARAERTVATALARLAKAGVQPAPATTPSEAIAAAAMAVGAQNLAQMPRYVPSASYAPGAGTGAGQ